MQERIRTTASRAGWSTEPNRYWPSLQQAALGAPVQFVLDGAADPR